jgi:hypothetical protein
MKNSVSQIGNNLREKVPGRRRSTIALLFLILAVFAAALLLCGGCGGSDGKPASAKPSLYKVGDIGSVAEAKLAAVGITVLPFDDSMTAKVADGSSFIFAPQAVRQVAAGGQFAQKLLACYEAGGEIVLLSADKTDVDSLFANVLTGYQNAAQLDGNDVLGLFAVTREKDGDIRCLCAAADGSDIPAATSKDVSGIGAVLSGDEFVVTSGEEVLRNNFMLIIGDSSITASGDTEKIACVGAVSGDRCWTLSGDEVISGSVGASEPGVSADKANDEEWNSLHDWLLEEDDETADAAAKTAAVSELQKRFAASPAYANTFTDNIAELAQSFKQKYCGRFNGKWYEMNLFIVSTHDFSTDRDWYVIEEECFINGADGYKGPYWRGGAAYNGECIDNYIAAVSVGHELVYTGGTYDSDVVTTQPAPTAINKEQNHTESSSFGVGAEVGVGTGTTSATISGKLSFSAGFSKSRSWSVKNVAATFDKPDSKHLNWKYTYNNKPVDSKHIGEWQKMIEAPADDLSRSTFKFYDLWVWQLNTADRSKTPALRVTPTVRCGNVWSRNSGSLPCGRSETDYTLSADVQWRYSLPQPPLMAVKSDDVVFQYKTEDNATVDVRAKGSWTATVASADWCRVTPTEKKLLIEVGANETKAARKAVITLVRDGTADKQTITVTQAATEKR